MTTIAVYQAYEFALDLTPRQQGGATSHVGGHRFAFNWGLELVKDRLDRRQAGEAVRVPWSLFELRREWNQAKQEVAPWWRENSKEAYSSGLDTLARALANWWESKQGRRKGARTGFPKRKRKGRGRESCSACGYVKAKLPLSERTYRCEPCGLVLDRDGNAGRNLAALLHTSTGIEVVAGSGPETRNARGADLRPGLTGQTAGNREAGTGRRPGKAGTVGAQAPAARTADTR